MLKGHLQSDTKFNTFFFFLYLKRVDSSNMYKK